MGCCLERICRSGSGWRGRVKGEGDGNSATWRARSVSRDHLSGDFVVPESRGDDAWSDKKSNSQGLPPGEEGGERAGRARGTGREEGAVSVALRPFVLPCMRCTPVERRRLLGGLVGMQRGPAPRRWSQKKASSWAVGTGAEPGARCLARDLEGVERSLVRCVVRGPSLRGAHLLAVFNVLSSRSLTARCLPPPNRHSC